MTRNDLLARLLALKAQGENMDLPLVVRTVTRTPDKRTRAGHRIVETFSYPAYATSGSVRVESGESLAEIVARPAPAPICDCAIEASAPLSHMPGCALRTAYLASRT